MQIYQGRPLPRPGADIVDQGLAFDLATMRRRQALRVFGLGAIAAGLGGCAGGPETATETSVLGEIPGETAGPYPGDGSNGPNVLTDSGVVRSDITASFGTATGKTPGVPMTLTLTLIDLAAGGTALMGAAVYVWHCDRAGAYSLYSDGVTGENYLRGVQVTDETGEVRFTSIFPACYPGRWPHVHFEVYPNLSGITDATKVIVTSQIALPEVTCDEAYQQAGYQASATNLAQVSLDTDNVFGDDSGAQQLATVTGSPMSGYAVTLEVGVETTTSPSGGPGGAPPSR